MCLFLQDPYNISPRTFEKLIECPHNIIIHPSHPSAKRNEKCPTYDRQNNSNETRTNTENTLSEPIRALYVSVVSLILSPLSHLLS